MARQKTVPVKEKKVEPQKLGEQRSGQLKVAIYKGLADLEEQKGAADIAATITLLELAPKVAEFKAGKGYLHFAKTWSEFMEKETLEFHATTLYYLAKLGKEPNVTACGRPGMKAYHLIEAVKVAEEGHVNSLLEKHWVKGSENLPIRKWRGILAQDKKPSTRGPKPDTPEQKLNKLLDKATDKPAFIRAMAKLVEENSNQEAQGDPSIDEAPAPEEAGGAGTKEAPEPEEAVGTSTDEENELSAEASLTPESLNRVVRAEVEANLKYLVPSPHRPEN